MDAPESHSPPPGRDSVPTNAQGDRPSGVVPSTLTGFSGEPPLSPAERQVLLGTARAALEHTLRGAPTPDPATAGLTPRLIEKRGCFVTLMKAGALRGCIGELTAEKPLHQAVADAAIGAALRDPRFEPLASDELPDLTIEISVLTEPRPLLFASPQDLLDQLRPHRDGVLLSVGFQISTFLPKVWEIIRDKVDFLDRLAQKAGLGRSDWRTPEAKVSVYEAETFGETVPVKTYVRHS